MYTGVLGSTFTAGTVGVTVLGAKLLPLTGLFSFAYYVVAAFTLLAAGLALARLAPKKQA